MNKLFYALGTLALCAACNQAPKPFVLEGTLKNCRSDYALLVNGIIGLRDTIRIAPDGTFAYARVLDEPGAAFMAFSDQEAGGMVLAVNGTANRLEADLNDPSSWKVSGDLQDAYPLYQSISQSLTTGIASPAPTFAAYRDNLQHLNDSLTDVSGQVGVDGFRQLVDNAVKSSTAFALIGYNERLAETGKAPDSDPDYNAYMGTIDLNQADDFAYLYLHWLNDCKAGPDSLSYLYMLQTVKEKATDPVARETLAKRLMAEYDQSGDPQLEAVCALAIEMLPDEKDKEWVRQKQVAMQGVLPGSPAIDCEWTDPQGNTSRLSDLFGTVIYMDVWATWCGPCCAEIPYIEKLVERFKNDGRIRFVSVSVDSNKEAWLKKLETDKPAWKQFLREDFCTLYGISGIPRFILIGRDGKIIDPNAPRPSSDGIISYLEEHMK